MEEGGLALHAGWRGLWGVNCAGNVGCVGRVGVWEVNVMIMRVGLGVVGCECHDVED